MSYLKCLDDLGTKVVHYHLELGFKPAFFQEWKKEESRRARARSLVLLSFPQNDVAEVNIAACPR